MFALITCILIEFAQSYNMERGFRFLFSAHAEVDSKCRFGKSSKYNKTCVKRPIKTRLQIGFQDQFSRNAGLKYYRMLHREHFTIL